MNATTPRTAGRRHEFPRPLTRKCPNGSAKGGSAGRTYVGSLHEDSEKNTTHQLPASRKKPSSGGRRQAASSFAVPRQRTKGINSTVAGSRPSDSTAM